MEYLSESLPVILGGILGLIGWYIGRAIRNSAQSKKQADYNQTEE